jgi:hypothetical protein
VTVRVVRTLAVQEHVDDDLRDDPRAVPQRGSSAASTSTASRPTGARQPARRARSSPNTDSFSRRHQHQHRRNACRTRAPPLKRSRSSRFLARPPSGPTRAARSVASRQCRSRKGPASSRSRRRRTTRCTPCSTCTTTVRRCSARSCAPSSLRCHSRLRASRPSRA